MANLIKRSSLRLLVHLHLFYHEQLDWFLKRLKNITSEYDLYVTVCTESDESSRKLRTFKQDVHIINVNNRGYDVYPFWQVLQRVDLNDYEYVLKLHTKNKRNSVWSCKGISYTGYQWRDALIEPLVGSRLAFLRCLLLLKGASVGMVGSRNLLLVHENPHNVQTAQLFCEQNNLQYSEELFVGGTMFMVRSSILKKFKDAILRDKDFSETSVTGTVGTLAHSIESVFGILVKDSGYRTVGVDCIHSWTMKQKTWLSKMLSMSGSKKQNKGTGQKSLPKRILESIFSVKNSPTRRHKVITLLGLRVKVRRRLANKGIGEQFITLKTITGINRLFWDKKIAEFKGRKNQPIAKNVVLSLTSYPQRMTDLSYTLFSLLNQSVLPERFILWLTLEEFPNGEKDLPESVLRFKKYGLEIWFADALRSYQKIIPSLQTFPDKVLVSADDDIFYPEDWLKILYQAYIKDPSRIYAHRIHRVAIDGNSIAPYNSWEKCIIDTKGEVLNFPTGVGGILYPPHCLNTEATDKTKFLALCPHADDVWLWAMGITNNKVFACPEGAINKLIYVSPEWELGLDGSSTLLQINVLANQNDVQISNVVQHYNIIDKFLRINSRR